MKKKAIDTSKEKRVKQEYERLTKIFDGLTPDESAVCQGLMIQAARLRILLDDEWADICDHGDVEMFTQSQDAPAYERLRPVAQIYNTRDKNYQTIIKQLCDRLPDGKDKAEAGAAAMKWVKPVGEK